MTGRTNRTSAVLAQSIQNWYPSDAAFVWSPFTDTDTTQVDPLIGGTLPKTSAGSNAVASTNLWNMSGVVYNNSTTGATYSINTALPWMLAVAVDRNTQSSTFSNCGGIGGSSAIGFGFSSNFAQPIFRCSLNSGAFTNNPIASTTLTAGTVQVLWFYCNPSDPTFQIQAGFNQTTVTQTGSLTIPAITMSRAACFGAANGSTTNVSQIKQGAMVALGNRSGTNALTLAQTLAIVKNIQNLYGV